jgi:hypothetical protein
MRGRSIVSIQLTGVGRLAKQSLCLILLSFLLSLSSCDGSGAGVSIAQLAVLSNVISQLQNALSQSISQADAAAANRINQAQIAANQAKKNIDDVITHGSNAAASQREDAARQAFAVIDQSRRLVDESGKELYSHLNEALASIAATLDAIPFVNIPDTVFAVSPYRIRTDSREKEFSIYGFFPSISTDVKAVKVTVDEKPVTVYRSVGKVAFDLSDDIFKSNKSVSNVVIQLPKPHWYSRTPTPIQTKLRKLNSTPYSFDVQLVKANPAAYVTLNGNEFTQYDDKDELPSYSAEQLFNATVPADARAKYDSNSAQLVNVTTLGGPKSHGSKACEDCPDPSGMVSKWDAGSVQLQMKAPGCGVHVIAKSIFNTYKCDGGGSNYYLVFIPTFTVHVKGTEEAVPISSRQIRAGWQSVSNVELPTGWSNAIVKLHYDDNFDSADAVLAAKPGIPTAAAALFDLRVEGNTLFISAH